MVGLDRRGLSNVDPAAAGFACRWRCVFGSIPFCWSPSSALVKNRSAERSCDRSDTDEERCALRGEERSIEGDRSCKEKRSPKHVDCVRKRQKASQATPTDLDTLAARKVTPALNAIVADVFAICLALSPPRRRCAPRVVTAGWPSPAPRGDMQKYVNREPSAAMLSVLSRRSDHVSGNLQEMAKDIAKEAK